MFQEHVAAPQPRVRAGQLAHLVDAFRHIVVNCTIMPVARSSSARSLTAGKPHPGAWAQERETGTSLINNQ